MSVEKSREEKAKIVLEVVNLLAEKNCTIDDASEIVNCVRWTIEHTSTVQKIKQSDISDNKDA